jgi:FtsH-binding integral membrane protein
MTMNGEIAGEPRGTLFRAAGWGIATALLILPMVATQFMPEVQWTTSDFIVWGIMLATVGGLFELAVRLSPLPSYRAGFGLALLGAFLVVWTNLAVGIVGSEHNPANALFFAALAVGIAGATISRLRASGMAKAMFATAIALGVAFAIALLGPTDEIDVPASREALGTGFFALLFVASGLLFRRAATHSSSSS